MKPSQEFSAAIRSEINGIARRQYFSIRLVTARWLSDGDYSTLRCGLRILVVQVHLDVAIRDQ